MAIPLPEFPPMDVIKNMRHAGSNVMNIDPETFMIFLSQSTLLEMTQHPAWLLCYWIGKCGPCHGIFGKSSRKKKDIEEVERQKCCLFADKKHTIQQVSFKFRMPNGNTSSFPAREVTDETGKVLGRFIYVVIGK